MVGLYVYSACRHVILLDSSDRGVVCYSENFVPIGPRAYKEASLLQQMFVNVGSGGNEAPKLFVHSHVLYWRTRTAMPDCVDCKKPATPNTLFKQSALVVLTAMIEKRTALSWTLTETYKVPNYECCYPGGHDVVYDRIDALEEILDFMRKPGYSMLFPFSLKTHFEQYVDRLHRFCVKRFKNRQNIRKHKWKSYIALHPELEKLDLAFELLLFNIAAHYDVNLYSFKQVVHYSRYK